MTGILRHLIGEHFAQSSNIQEPALRDLLWRADGTGNILIESVTRWKPEELGKRPAVIIKRNDWQNERLFPADQYGVTPQGDAMFLTLMHGSHTLFCLSKAGEEAELLAAEVFAELRGFASLFRQILGLTRFVPMGLGPIFELEEAHETYAVPVNVAYAHQDSWIVHPQAAKLRSIDVLHSELVP